MDLYSTILLLVFIIFFAILVFYILNSLRDEEGAQNLQENFLKLKKEDREKMLKFYADGKTGEKWSVVDILNENFMTISENLRNELIEKFSKEDGYCKRIVYI